MTALTRYCVVAIATLGSLAPVTAAAQTVASSFEELQRILSNGQIVVVTDDTGRRIKGRVVDVAGPSLTIQSTHRLVLPENTVKEVRRSDSSLNGMLIGAGVGVGVFGVGRLICEANKWNCGAARGAENWIPGSPVSAWLGPLAGGIAGALIDRARGNDLVYLAPSHASRPSVSVSPVLGKKISGLDISLSMRF